MGNLLGAPKMPKPKPIVPLPQDDDEAIRRTRLGEFSRLSREAGRGAVSLTAQKDLGSFGTGELRTGLAAAPIMTG